MSAVARRFGQLSLGVAMQALCLFLPAGTFAWAAAWWYLGLYLLLLGIGSAVLLPHHREVVVARSEGAAGAKRWDLVITRLLAIPTLGLLSVAGFDLRQRWTPSWPAWTFVVGVVLFVAGYGLVLWAMRVNRFFAQVVRIQSERGHVAITSGPYRIVRHPGYLGMTISLMGAFLFLGSAPAGLCVVGYVVLMVIRTALEDRTLQAELPGYRDFAARTRYRLLPGLW